MDVENQVEGSHIGRKCDIGYPVVQMDEWTDGRKVTWLPKFLRRRNFLSYGAPQKTSQGPLQYRFVMVYDLGFHCGVKVASWNILK